MRIKTKLALGLIFLFSIIILVGVIGLYSINRLSDQSKAVLKANYESLEYIKNVEQALDRLLMHDNTGLVAIEQNLKAQENNITEAGERDLTQQLRNDFEQLKKDPGNEELILSMRSTIYKITELNMIAIRRKNADAQSTAEHARIYLSIIGTICALLSFSLIVNFPGYIANPIHDLTQGIKQIAKKNYSQRLFFKSSDEFGELADAFNTMAKKLDDYEHSNLAEAIFEKKRIETIINNMKDPVIGFNEKNIILFANEEATKILGTGENDLAGRYAPDVAMQNDLLRNLLTADAATVKPLKIFANQKESFFTKEVYPISSEGQPIGKVIVLKNITHFQELDVAKTNFIATISHELKTPISSVMMSLKLLEDNRVGEINSEQRKLIDNISEDAQRLLKITGELLDLAQVEAGNIQLRKQAVDPKEIVSYAYNALKSQAQQKQIDVKTDYSANLPRVNCDMEKTAWVMVNFLSNAIRHSNEGSKIIMGAHQENGAVIFSVQDFGIGIDPIYKDKIFDRFFQVPSGEPSRSGSGLGLTISKEFIVAQGGKIWVNSKVNEGSIFFFSLSV